VVCRQFFNPAHEFFGARVTNRYWNDSTQSRRAEEERMKIVMFGSLLKVVMETAAEELPDHHVVSFLPDRPESDEQRQTFAEAEVIVGIGSHEGWPQPGALRMWQVPAAGSDRVDTTVLPDGAVVCNLFGHEIPIAEYIMASLLHWQLPLVDAFERMKNNDWFYFMETNLAERKEVYEKTLGILGFGMIGGATATRAKAFGMRVLACNRGRVEVGGDVDEYFPLDQVRAFAAQVDFLAVSLALVEATANIVDRELLAGMKADAVIINVGRAGLIDEVALFDALRERRIRGAVLDPQYNYPTPGNPNPKPTNLDFTALDNALLTSHMSGGSDRLVARRARYVIENVARLDSGEPPANVVWPSP